MPPIPFVVLLCFVVMAARAEIAIRGVNAHSVRQEESDFRREQDVLAAARMGASSIRVDIFWEAFEQTPVPWLYNDPQPLCDGNDKQNFKRLDQFVTLCESNGIKPLLMIYGTPAWASSAPTGVWEFYRYPPKDPLLYAIFCEKIAARYYGKLAGIEVWNEPNLSWFWYQYSEEEGGPEKTAAEYVKLYKTTYQHIKGGLWPDTKIVAGALSSAPRSFMKLLYMAGGKGFYDAFSVHPYSGTPEGTRNLTYRFKEYMITNSDNADLWLTEHGWSSAPSVLSPSDYADYHERALWLLDYLSFSNKPVAAVYPFQIRDTPTDGEYFGFSGLVDTNFQPKAAFFRVQTFYETWRLGKPILKWDRNGTGLMLNWILSGAEGFTLEHSFPANPSSWSPITITMSTNINGRVFALGSSPAGSRFFRLRR